MVGRRGSGRETCSTFAPPPAVLEEDIIKDTKSLNELFWRGRGLECRRPSVSFVYVLGLWNVVLTA